MTTERELIKQLQAANENLARAIGKDIGEINQRLDKLEGIPNPAPVQQGQCLCKDKCLHAGAFGQCKGLPSVLAAQPAPVQQGWKLVPVEPTEDMWKAVNKLDDEMAAGSYDGKGCSIEQAWNCLLAAAPQPAQQSCYCPNCEALGKELAELKAQQEPIYQLKKADGSWIDQAKHSYDYNVKHGSATVRVVYPSPQPAQQDIPDLIAGTLGVSRGTAYDLMREALAEQPAPVQEPVAKIESAAAKAVNYRTDYQKPLTARLEQLAERHDFLKEEVKRLEATLAEQPAPVQQELVAVELVGVEKAIKEGDGFWKSCTGCYETNEGHPPNGAFFSPVFKCHMGHGCSECGGIGAIWDDTDYEAMADHMMRDDAAPQPAQRKPKIPEEIEAEFQAWLTSYEYMKDAPKKDYPISYAGMEGLSIDCMRFAWKAAHGITPASTSQEAPNAPI